MFRSFKYIPPNRLADAAITAIVYYILIQLSLSVNDQWRTATSLLQGSRGVMATWLIADSYAAISVRNRDTSNQAASKDIFSI